MFIFVVYDVTQRDSFASLEMWLTELDTYATKKDLVKMLVGNKIDKASIETYGRVFLVNVVGCVCKLMHSVYMCLYVISYCYGIVCML